MRKLLLSLLAVGASFREHYYLGVSYETSFINIARTDTVHNNTWMITLGYNF